MTPDQTPVSRQTWIRVARAVASRDLRAEIRHPASLSTLVLFATGALVTLHLALAGSADPGTTLKAGALWISVLLGAQLVVARGISAEHDTGTWDALLLAPCGRSAIYAGKVTAMLALLLTTHVLLLPTWALLFSATLDVSAWSSIALTLLLVDAGLAASGVLVGTMGMRARSRELLAAVTLLPMTLPLLIGGVVATLAAVDPTSGPLASALGFCGLFDLVVLALGLGLVPELADD